CSMHLADHGAEVIKIEDKKKGDYARSDMAFGISMSHLFHALNRGKKSVALDLSSSEDRDAFLKLLDSADIVMESFRPGVLDKFDLSHQMMRTRKPNLIICALTAYGQTGPRKDEPAHDNNMLGYVGIADQFPTIDGCAVPPNFQIADIAGGSLTALSAISMALVRRERTGEGATLDISLSEGAMCNAVIPFAMRQLHGHTPKAGQDVLTGMLPAYGFYPTKDDRQIAMGALEPKFWGAFCHLVNRPDLMAKGIALGPAAEEVKKELITLFRTKTYQEWGDILKAADACVTPVQTLDEAIEDPHIKDRGVVYKAEDPVDGPLLRLASPIVVDGERPRPEAPAPRHGEHTDAVIKENMKAS
ncbi:MAG: CoA transferase, partial [Pseudomonadota bacterium]